MKPIIETGVPAPPLRVRRLTKELKDMNPGESVVVDRPTVFCLKYHGRKQGWKMVTRKEGENGAGMVRFWRVA